MNNNTTIYYRPISGCIKFGCHYFEYVIAKLGMKDVNVHAALILVKLFNHIRKPYKDLGLSTHTKVIYISGVIEFSYLSQIFFF